MIKLDADEIRELVSTYIYSDEIEGRDSEILNTLSYLYEDFDELERCEFCNGEVNKVLNSFQFRESDEEMRKNQKAIRGVNGADIALIASHFGFMFGMAYAEKLRLKFE